MFSKLTHAINGIFSRLKSKGILKESDINDAMREIRVALLEADVSLAVVKEFIEKVKIKAIGQDVVKSVSPGQMVIKIVHDEMVKILAGEGNPQLSEAKNDIRDAEAGDTEYTFSESLDKLKGGVNINLNCPAPAMIMLIGLQGSGKTTTAGKLGLLIKKKLKKEVLLVSTDVYRPAAQEQLAKIGKEIEIDTLEIISGQKPLEITKRALKSAKQYDVVIFDTAGRLQTNEELMEELNALKKLMNPIEILLVVDSMIGQEAVHIAQQFHKSVNVTGIILTKIDGDARGGAALSMRFVTGCPIKFVGTGESINMLENFYAERAASRILGMGDVVSLVERAAEAVEIEDAENLAKKLEKGHFDLNDLLSQLRNIKKIGNIGSLLGMIPGLGKLREKLEGNVDDGMMKRQEAIILSMTLKERRTPDIINGARKIRIAKGSGSTVQSVNILLKRYKEMKGMMKSFKNMNPSKMQQMLQMFN